MYGFCNLLIYFRNKICENFKIKEFLIYLFDVICLKEKMVIFDFVVNLIYFFGMKILIEFIYKLV